MFGLEKSPQCKRRSQLGVPAQVYLAGGRKPAKPVNFISEHRKRGFREIILVVISCIKAWFKSSSATMMRTGLPLKSCSQRHHVATLHSFFLRFLQGLPPRGFLRLNSKSNLATRFDWLNLSLKFVFPAAFFHIDALSFKNSTPHASSSSRCAAKLAANAPVW